MENNQPSLDAVFHALADPTRRAIVQRLGRKPTTVSELAAPFDMGLPSFLKHLGVLEASGLIVSHKVGRTRTCALNRQAMQATERWFESQREDWADRFGKLDTLLSKLTEPENET